MRWEGQKLESDSGDALPGLAKISNLIRSVQTPEFAGVTFHEVAAKSALNRVGPGSAVPFAWTINPYRGCSHACVYCFARPSHRYLDLDAGKDFDSQVIVKVNVAEALRRDLARPTWTREHVALGTNTDPYQRAEGKYRLMPGIISALAESRTPFSILTKGTLLRRDLPQLTEAAKSVDVQLAMSIAIFDDDLQSTMEPGTPTTAARLATVAAAVEAGFDVAVFMMPILPFLTDSAEHLDGALARIKQAGATHVSYTGLHLRPGVKEWYAAWLHRHRPDLVPKYRALYGDGAYAPKSYRRRLANTVKPLMEAHGLAKVFEDPGTGSAATRAEARDPDGEWRKTASAVGTAAATAATGVASAEGVATPVVSAPEQHPQPALF